MKVTSTPLLLAGLSTLATAQYHTSVPIETRSLDEIYAAAKQETNGTRQPLQVFWGGDAGTQGNGVRNAWKQRFPDIPLNLTVDLSKYHDGRIDTAYFEGRHVADIAVLQTLQDFYRWRSQNRLLYYKPATFDDLYNGEKDLNGAFLGLFTYGFGTIQYDTSKLNITIPDTYEAFARPEWRSKLVLTYPNDDDAVAYLFSVIVSKYGRQWLEDLANNDVQWVRGTASNAFEISRQHNSTNSSRALTFTGSASSESWWASKQPQDQRMSWAQTGAIIADTPRPEASKLFMSWLASVEYQNSTRNALYSLNTDDTNAYLSNTTQLTGFRVFEQDRAGVEWWKNIFEDVLGTPQGVSPLELYPNPPYAG